MLQEPSTSLSDKLIHFSEARLADWDIRSPLDVAYDVWINDYDKEVTHSTTSNPRYLGYGLWASRIGDQSFMASLPNGVIENKKQTESLEPDQASDMVDDTISPTMAAVEFVALMENTRLSIGLMMVFERDLGSDKERLYCMHYYDTMQRLVSATDRLRRLYITGLCGMPHAQQKFLKFLRFGKYRETFNMEHDSPSVKGFRLRKKPEDWEAFVSLHVRLQEYVREEGDPIPRIRAKRNRITHALGTIPGERIRAQIGKGGSPQIPSLITIYGPAGYSALEPGDFGAYIAEVVEDYQTVLEFGALVFELVESLDRKPAS